MSVVAYWPVLVIGGGCGWLGFVAGWRLWRAERLNYRRGFEAGYDAGQGDAACDEDIRGVVAPPDGLEPTALELYPDLTREPGEEWADVLAAMPHLPGDPADRTERNDDARRQELPAHDPGDADGMVRAETRPAVLAVPVPSPLAALAHALELPAGTQAGLPGRQAARVTPAQRRRDRHKRRGPYAPDLPRPGTWYGGNAEHNPTGPGQPFALCRDHGRRHQCAPAWRELARLRDEGYAAVEAARVLLAVARAWRAA